MVKCAPHSVFSWNYAVSGLVLGSAQLTFEPFSDQGVIAFDGIRLGVRKEGWINARWTLERDGEAVAVANKHGMLGRRFELTHGDQVFLLKPQTPITRGYDIFLGDTVVGTIEPDHPLTRVAHIECKVAVAEVVQLFSFWLVAMVWRSTTDTAGV